MKKVFLTSDKDGIKLKNIVKENLIHNKRFTIIDLTPEGAEDFIASTNLIVEALNNGSSEDLGIAFDAYGVGSFMAANKHKGMIVAEISDERSAYMTREHNNTKLITLGSEILGSKLAINIANEFITAKYDGGRHQVRVDMLNSMC
ncbi:galactose-6-phosphate isomerase subunit LacA [Aerococcaceae bacterium zg-BR9]|uniref:galactose-6-phosphate isomerase subunit LacA n=1 Tax=Aerococcaceae bacterium zg-1292 TaxID=2774330 RepID=UPI004062A42E|nr:galactose-6-phosphate isomerase subunit LacA [Aerococcaceae bacterium zg-BR9]